MRALFHVKHTLKIATTPLLTTVFVSILMQNIGFKALGTFYITRNAEFSSCFTRFCGNFSRFNVCRAICTAFARKFLGLLHASRLDLRFPTRSLLSDSLSASRIAPRLPISSLLLGSGSPPLSLFFDLFAQFTLCHAFLLSVLP